MKKAVVLCALVISMIALTSCTSAVANTNTINGTMLELSLNENYDDTDPFINEKLFCVSEDLDNLTAKCQLEMDGETGILEVKNNKTNEVLWSDTWEGTVKSTTFSISLDNMKKDSEYVVCFTGTGIKNATIEVTFDSDKVQERERPAE